MSEQLTAGLDLGSTTIKALVLDAHGLEVASVEAPHPVARRAPWRHRARCLGAHLGPASADGRPRREAVGRRPSARRRCGPSPSPEWARPGSSSTPPARPLPRRSPGSTRAGSSRSRPCPPRLRQEFPSRTGLPLGVQVSGGQACTPARPRRGPGRTAVARSARVRGRELGANRVAELSLASRTGLIDQDTGRPWPEMLAHLGVRADFLPPWWRPAPISDRPPPRGCPPSSTAPALTVAGHDHLVAAAVNGAAADGRYYASIGTAEVLVRVLDHPLPAAARERLAEHLINYVRHVVPGQYVLVAGVKTGLLMRRVLQLAGITDRAGRDRLDAEVLAPARGRTAGPGGDRVTGARNDDGVLALTVRSDGVSPAELFAAALRHGNAELQRLIEAMDREVAPADGHRPHRRLGEHAQRPARPLPRATGRGRVHPQPGDRLRRSTLRASARARMPCPPPPPDPTPQTTHRPDHPKEEHPMNTMTTLEQRALSRISTPEGRLLIVAADQRNGMKAVMPDADRHRRPPRSAPPSWPRRRPTSSPTSATTPPRSCSTPRSPCRRSSPTAPSPRTPGWSSGWTPPGSRRGPACATPATSTASPPARSATSAATPRRCSSTCAPTSRAPARTSTPRSATSSTPVTPRACCSSSSCSPTAWTTRTSRPTRSASPARRRSRPAGRLGGVQDPQAGLPRLPGGQRRGHGRRRRHPLGRALRRRRPRHLRRSGRRSGQRRGQRGHGRTRAVEGQPVHLAAIRESLLTTRALPRLRQLQTILGETRAGTNQRLVPTSA